MGRYGLCDTCCAQPSPPPEEEEVTNRVPAVQHLIENNEVWNGKSEPNYSNFYVPSKTRLIPPSGTGILIDDYWVTDRSTCRWIGYDPPVDAHFTLWTFQPSLPGGASSKAGHMTGFHTPAANGRRYLHQRYFTRLGYETDIQTPPPGSLWDQLVQGLSFTPSSIVLRGTLVWDWGIYGVYFGETQGWSMSHVAEDVTIQFSGAAQFRSAENDEVAARAMLAGNLGGTEIEGTSRSETLFLAKGTYFWKSSLGQLGPRAVAKGEAQIEMDVTSYLQSHAMDSGGWFSGVRMSPSFAPPSIVFASWTAAPPGGFAGTYSGFAGYEQVATLGMSMNLFAIP